MGAASSLSGLIIIGGIIFLFVLLPSFRRSASQTAQETRNYFTGAQPAPAATDDTTEEVGQPAPEQSTAETAKMLDFNMEEFTKRFGK